MRSHAGQASTEYVAVLALLAIVLAGAGTAIAAPEIPRAVVHELRKALCIVGGDVCRSSDAARRGLEPCVVADEEHERETGINFVFFRTTGGEQWSVQRRSDGRFLLSASYDQHLGGTTGFGAKLGPVLNAGGTLGATAGFRSGRTWEVPDEAALRRLLDRVDGFDLSNSLNTFAARFPEPASTFLEGGGTGNADLAASALKGIPAGGAGARGAIGRRKERGHTTYYLDLGAGSTGPLADALPALDRNGSVLAEWRTGDPPALTLRTASGHGDTEVQSVAHLRLDDPADLAAARRLAFVSLADPAFAARDLARRIAARGSVQRFTYRTTTDDDAWSYGLELGATLGADHSASVMRRKLVDAQILNGPLPARRADCLGI